MKKKFLLFLALFVLFLNSGGYCFANDNQISEAPNNTVLVKYCDTCRNCQFEKPCDLCQPQCLPCQKCEICPPSEECAPCCTEVSKIGEPCNCAYNAPARIDTACGWDTWLSLSFIYWQARERGLRLAEHHYFLPDGREQFKPVQMDFDYHPGFKIGAGLSICRDDWTLSLEYTRLKSVNHHNLDLGDSFNPSSDYLIIILQKEDTSYFARSLSGKWDLSYNILDLKLGRPYYLGRKLVFKPHFGLRSGWIDQKLIIHSRFDNEDLVNIQIISKSIERSWLIGPRAGVDTDWLLGCNYKIIGNVGASLTYQHFKTSFASAIPVQPGIAALNETDGKEEVSSLTPNVEFGIGIGYGTYLCNNQWHFDLSATYDFNYFWNQNMIKPLKDYTAFLSESESGNLMLHGLTITARLDF